LSGIKRIAILGANSQIALDYIESSLKNTNRELYLFSRNPIALQNLVDTKCISRFKSLGYDRFGLDAYDLIINFVGGSDPVLIANMDKDIFTITDQYDDLAIDYLKKNDQCKYIFISSGAAYGDVFSNAPASELTKSNFDLNNLTPADYYGAAKYLAEQRHRKLAELNIIDIRIFSYISKRQNLESKLFLPQVISAIKNKTNFLTSDEEMWRDYIGPEDFFNFLECTISSIFLNESFDCFSCSPISKLRLLEMAAQEFGLKALISKSAMKKTDPKKWYYSDDKRAEAIGYCPIYDSLDSIRKTVIAWI
jgi:nucleoside-diphosphate-sugar epimerase